MTESLAHAARDGNRRALARILSQVENGTPDGMAALAELFPHSGQAHIIGITGSPGAGKSTLLNRLAQEIRALGERLAIVAVDPSSPYSGGALLGDRLRMRDLMKDPDVFIRSMASRGHPGGIAHATRDVVTVLDAVGIPVILVETVGAGQAQVEVAQVAHTVVLVEAPGMGDDIQALKAGLMEIADIIVVNKADRPEATQTVRALQSIRTSQSVGHHQAQSTEDNPSEAFVDGWDMPILKTSALDGSGMVELLASIQAHRAHLEHGGTWDTLHAHHARGELENWLRKHLWTLAMDKLDKVEYEQAVKRVILREQDPASAAKMLLDNVIKKTGDK